MVTMGGTDPELEKRRALLSAELSKHTGGTDKERPKTSGWGEATKIASEFVAGIVVGVGLGLIIDHVFGTSPFGLIICLLLIGKRSTASRGEADRPVPLRFGKIRTCLGLPEAATGADRWNTRTLSTRSISSRSTA
jgi:F0F1-type ATP synthase assembly protein I